MRGFYQLAHAKDLLAKLGRDLERIQLAPSDADPAYDFFVTAEHMLDWLFPGKNGKLRRESARKSEPLLQLVSHIATGAKHMVPEAQHHKAVQSTEAPTSVHPYAPLVVNPDPAVAEALGFSSITTLGLAAKVYDYWRAWFMRNPTAV